MTGTRTISRQLSIKAKTLWTIAAAAAAVALPQLLHFLGIISGSGAALGEMFLPMHLPVMLAGLIAGPAAGAISGLCAPLISHSLTAMPSAALLPFMTVELCVYGLCGGLLKDAAMPKPVKVLTVQLAGRIVRAAVILAAVYLFKASTINVSIIWLSVKTGLAGIVLQLAVIPLILKLYDSYGEQ